MKLYTSTIFTHGTEMFKPLIYIFDAQFFVCLYFTEIDELYTRKRTLLSNYHREKEEYYALLKDIREHEKRIKREEEAMKRIEENHQQRQQNKSEG